MSKPYIINIQKFSVHDGPGIRTTVFFKGCPLRCAWCHNPESQHYGREFLFDGEKCTGCGYCVKGCNQGAIHVEEYKATTDTEKCTLCEACTDYCLLNNREIAGKQYEIEELVGILLKDQIFYEQSGGGVTLSGGEVMTQDMDYIEELCKRLKAHQISIAIDTCGMASKENYARLLPYIDLYLYDIKAMDDEIHKKYTGQSNQQILANLEYLTDQSANLNIRIPVIPLVNDSEEEIFAIITYLKKHVGYPQINLLPYHNTGSSKYAKLGREYETKAFQVPDHIQMERLKKLFEEHGFTAVKIGG